MSNLPDYAGWMARNRAALRALRMTPEQEADDFVAQFFRHHYTTNSVIQFGFAGWPALDWTIDSLRTKVGADTPVQVQVGRTEDPHYELRSEAHRETMPFGDFLGAVTNRPGNAVYMTANNRSQNDAALAPLWPDVVPLPRFLRDRSADGFIWLGRNTVTPLHHDETNNLLCQVMGSRIVRLFPPEDRDKLSPTVGVFSDLKWVNTKDIAERGLRHIDVHMNPGDALFVPIGWWHCVVGIDVSLMISFTNFVWQNFWGRVTDRVV